MDKLTRRSLLRTLAGGALGTLGTVVIARTSVAEAAEATGGLAPVPGGDLQDRAMRLAEFGSEGMTSAPAQLFLNGGLPVFGGLKWRQSARVAASPGPHSPPSATPSIGRDGRR